MTSCQRELDDVKTQYVTVCQERAAVDAHWQEKLDAELTSLRTELQTELQQALNEQSQTLAAEHQVALEDARDTWRQQQQAQHKQELDNEVDAAVVCLPCSSYSRICL